VAKKFEIITVLEPTDRSLSLTTNYTLLQQKKNQVEEQRCN
jgi:hypothetical protein